MTSSSAAKERQVILAAYLEMSSEDFQEWLYERCGHVRGERQTIPRERLEIGLTPREMLESRRS